MPHSRQPPNDLPSLLATADPDPEWLAALEKSPIPAGRDYGDDPLEAISLLKQMGKATYPRQRALLTANRPSDVTELEVVVSIPPTELVATAAKNRVLLCHPTSPDPNLLPQQQDKTTTVKPLRWPVVILFHGGGHCLGTPEMELPLARLLVQRYNALVVLPAYRLAPENPFPTSFNDCFETLKQIAVDTAIASQSVSGIQVEQSDRKSQQQPKFLPASLISRIDVSSGFVIGGTSAGSTIASAISHLYRAHCASTVNLHLPHLTGLFLSCGSTVNSRQISRRYQSIYCSHEQNRDCLPLDSAFYDMVFAAVRPDWASPFMASLDQRPKLNRDSIAEDHVWIRDGGIRVYLQACGMDMNRDDMLVYERVLRDEVGVETRLDLYSGFGHCFWGMSGVYAEMDMTKRRTAHTIGGIGWLLRADATA